ncbi:MAG: ABC transporter substrate-binding protein [Andreesenia angusta]|nr:ABC transporter substrate-binding protein [Andreesenia angusta]
MKKITRLTFLILGACLILYGLLLYSEKSEGYKSGNIVQLYNWGDYIDPDLIEKFEEESGYKVVYETYDSNEAMYTKIEQGGNSYDLAVPSDYMISKMIKNDMLIPLDYKKINGLDNIDQRFLDHSFDKKNKYSIPYFWGTLGIIYNDKFIEEGEIEHWDDLWNPKYKNNIMLIDGAREVMGLSLNSMGKSVNNTNIEDLINAKEKLDSLVPNIRAIVADEMKMYMVQEESMLAVTFSGEASEMVANNENLHYIIPPEGSNLWFDNIVIPKTAKNLDGAYALINFLLEPENAAQNAEYIGYATPNTKAMELMPEEVVTDKQFYPSKETVEHLEVYEDLGIEMLGIYNDYFLSFKMHRK